MIKLIAEFPSFKWYDLMNPQTEDLQRLEEEFGIPKELSQDILDPIKLPKYEKVNNTQFFLFRVYDRKSEIASDGLTALTRKMAVFLGPGFMLTSHRLPEPEIFSFSNKCLNHALEFSDVEITPTMMLLKLLQEGHRSFFEPLEKIEDELEEFEADLFSRQFTNENFQFIHTNRRRLSIFKRLFMHSQELILRTQTVGEQEKLLLEDFKETLKNLLFISDEMMESANSLLSLQISLASQKTNEVVRVLTIFSVFFMPLTFIVGVYGMNFANMPELHAEYGYPLTWLAMVLVTLLIAYWFNRKGWLNFKN